MKKLLTLVLAAGTFLSCTAQEPKQEEVREYSPYIGDFDPGPLPENYDKPLFGDTHFHTSWSTDAGMLGINVGPDVAYRAARGEEVTSQSGYKFKLIRPLDFVLLSDHSENLGLADFIRNEDPLLKKSETGRRWIEMVKNGQGYDVYLEWARNINTDQINVPEMVENIWAKVVDNAEKYNEPGVFTTFIGYEFTSAPNSNNLHRNLIFRDNAKEALQYFPYSAFNSGNPEDMWEFLAKYEETTGGRVLAIPHNPNFSNGLMFDDKTYEGDELTKEWIETRSRFETIVEVSQLKGDSEAHPNLSPDDQFADFVTMSRGNMMGSVEKTDEMLYKEYARYAYLEGLKIERKHGLNPYKFGMIGSTDAHGGISSQRNENAFGKGSFMEPNPDRADGIMVKGYKEELSIFRGESGAGGLCAVWAKENNRESIFDAMERKEVYATSGTRMSVRVFGGFDFSNNDLDNLVDNGYAKGVPMGGDLDANNGQKPGFMIRAQKDPDGANLDRVQVIKGWIDADGNTFEKVFDAAVSDNRKINKAGVCETNVGSTIDYDKATYTNDIGAEELVTYWEDPEFDASQNAFYYVRVLEIPTPRWTLYDKVFFGSEVGEGIKLETQERAYASPIWYNAK
ncbi:DUF3604 domain-containing protein [Flammeovirga aprica]|uniref:DUF3604 domain-containing protein n=1 Tax=Flammeovirga aprica JL-4 TaxID=694437 RepID=A0A7X9P1V9_9BACT|nr:DUF3604 domain-containing protein [Flammeovirga aprica]NME68019.1 DUF3604 domain-containing protein [Flammeovirga aprica JL-4]